MSGGLKGERGSSAVEFALVMPLLFVLLLGVAQMGIVGVQYLQVAHAAREAVHWAALGEPPTRVREAAKRAATELDPPLADSQITISPPQVVLPHDYGRPVVVTVRYPASLGLVSGLFGILPGGSGISDSVILIIRATMRAGG